MDWLTPTAELLRQFGWMSVLSVYHIVILAYKVMQAKAPKYLYTMFNTEYSYKTRQAYSGMIRNTITPELDISKDSFRWRATDLDNQLPATIREIKTLQSFK